MMQVWKYSLNWGRNVHSMPQCAQILTAQMQHDSVVMWALVDPSMPKELRSFDVYGTGHEMPAHPGNYVATIQMKGGALVIHVFEPRAI
jgi:hypothetical protein